MCQPMGCQEQRVPMVQSLIVTKQPGRAAASLPWQRVPCAHGGCVFKVKAHLAMSTIAQPFGR